MCCIKEPSKYSPSPFVTRLRTLGTLSLTISTLSSSSSKIPEPNTDIDISVKLAPVALYFGHCLLGL